MTREEKAALAAKAAAAAPMKARPPFVKWVPSSRGGANRVAMPAFVQPDGRCPDGWAVEGSPEEAAMKQAAESAPAPATPDWRRVSVLPAKPVGPETETDRKARLSNPEHGTLEYLETVKWPADAKGAEVGNWEAWRARHPWAAEADALAAEPVPEPDRPAAPPTVRRPPPVASKAIASPTPPVTGRRPPPIMPRRTSS